MSSFLLNDSTKCQKVVFFLVREANCSFLPIDLVNLIYKYSKELDLWDTENNKKGVIFDKNGKIAKFDSIITFSILGRRVYDLNDPFIEQIII